MSKISVIGAGAVGATIGYTLLMKGVASEIVLVDINKYKSEGEALDIMQSLPYAPQSKIYSGEYSDTANSDIVVITSGMPRKPGMSRLDLAQNNVNIIKSVAKNLMKYTPNSIFVILCNPVDILTYIFQKVTGVPESRVIGTGALLDTARLRTRIAEDYAVSTKNVHTYVFGEHGESAMIPWSISNVSGIPVKEYAKYLVNKNDVKQPELDFDEIEEHVKKSGSWIIERKGVTNYAVSACTCHLCSCILSGHEIALSVSTIQHGEYEGVDDVALSTLALVGRNGIAGKVVIPLTDDELKLLQNSANKLKSVLHDLEY